MDAYTGYIYAALWLILAIYLLIQAIKNYKFLFVISGFFFFMFCWYLANELLSIDLFSGVYSLIFKGVAIAVLIVCAVAYLIHKKRQNAENMED
ncbi:MAG: hypothetical protein IJD68_00250 [Ruminococcus sp.]|nr:hypothetical protein [Ruminococcus sp.]